MLIAYARHQSPAFQAVDQLGGAAWANSLSGGDVAHAHTLTQQESAYHLHLVDRNPSELGKLDLKPLRHRRLEATAEFRLSGH
jgi:hypothetical protein